MLQAENVLFTITILLYVAAMVFYLLFIAVKKESFAKIATLIQLVGLVLHTVVLICRGIGAGALSQLEAAGIPCDVVREEGCDAAVRGTAA